MVRYSVRLCNPKTHLFSIEIAFHVKNPRPTLLLRLPRWISGSYLIREFAAQVQDEKVFINGASSRIEKTGLSTWRIRDVRLTANAKVCVTYSVWAFDTSVRTAYLDSTRVFFNPGALFMSVQGQEHDPIQVCFHLGESNTSWNIASGLPDPPRNCHVNPYKAKDYAELLDAPFCLGNFKKHTFRVRGCEHSIVLINAPENLDSKRLIRDIRKICDAQITFFDPEKRLAPMKRYTFFLRASQNQFGGLEHSFSAVLTAPTKCLPLLNKPIGRKDYISLLGLFSHEYFHLWNVKRIVPLEFVGIDFSHEVPTRLLWFFEGVTSYYESLFLVRTGLISVEEYLDLLSDTLREVLSTHAQEVQTLSASSFDAWIKFYRPTANSVNANVSYYRQGALAALVLDSTIRQITNDVKSLDDVMRQILSHTSQTGKGIRRSDIEQSLYNVSQKNLRSLLRRLTETTQRPDYGKSLAPYGIELVQEKLPIERQILGLRSRRDATGIAVTRVYAEETGERLGISPGDLIASVGSKKATQANWDSLLKNYSEGKRISVRIRRDGRSLILRGVVGKAPICISRAREKALTEQGLRWLTGHANK